jgi:hypothetical protein
MMTAGKLRRDSRTSWLVRHQAPPVGGGGAWSVVLGQAVGGGCGECRSVVYACDTWCAVCGLLGMSITHRVLLAIKSFWSVTRPRV